MTKETRKVIEQLRSYICGARTAAYHAMTPDYGDEEDLEYTEGLVDGYKKGLYNGYEGCLGILETVETQIENNIIDFETDEDYKAEIFNEIKGKLTDGYKVIDDLEDYADKEKALMSEGFDYAVDLLNTICGV